MTDIRAEDHLEVNLCDISRLAVAERDIRQVGVMFSEGIARIDRGMDKLTDRWDALEREMRVQFGAFSENTAQLNYRVKTIEDQKLSDRTEKHGDRINILEAQSFHTSKSGIAWVKWTPIVVSILALLGFIASAFRH